MGFDRAFQRFVLCLFFPQFEGVKTDSRETLGNPNAGWRERGRVPGILRRSRRFDTNRRKKDASA